MDEAWKQVFGKYEVSNYGKIRNTKTLRIKSQCLDKSSGYYKMQLWENNQYKSVFVHRLIAEQFVSNPDNKRQVNHKNGIKTDNRVENLEWVTQQENAQHVYSVLGKEIAKRKLSADDVSEMKKLLQNCGIGVVAKKYGVSADMVRRIKAGRNWSYVN